MEGMGGVKGRRVSGRWGGETGGGEKTVGKKRWVRVCDKMLHLFA